MFSDFDAQTRQMLTGNLLMIGCCIFYLAWWLIAFKPQGAIKGLRSGWLLIPALLFGVDYNILYIGRTNDTVPASEQLYRAIEDLYREIYRPVYGRLCKPYVQEENL